MCPSAYLELFKRVKKRTAAIRRRTFHDLMAATSIAEGVVSKDLLAALGGAGSLPRTSRLLFPKIDHSAFFPHTAALNSVVKQMGLAGLSGFDRGVAEMALQHHLNLRNSLRRSLDGFVPKLDVACLMPRPDFSALIASSVPRGMPRRTVTMRRQRSPTTSCRSKTPLWHKTPRPAARPPPNPQQTEIPDRDGRSVGPTSGR
ncbi:hypothetical protein [Streptomyces sp. NPDC091027]|uniref:hypothetical protein n=1 Tax=Streptomyces sp. NPDC091027 TaxID=3365971 RepID=UPI00382EA4BD